MSLVEELAQGKDATSLCEYKSVKEVLTWHAVIPTLLQVKGRMIQPGTHPSSVVSVWPLENRYWVWREWSVVSREGLSVLWSCIFLSSKQGPGSHPFPAIPHTREGSRYSTLSMALFPVTHMDPFFLPFPTLNCSKAGQIHVMQISGQSSNSLMAEKPENWETRLGLSLYLIFYSWPSPGHPSGNTSRDLLISPLFTDSLWSLSRNSGSCLPVGALLTSRLCALET